jgi:hypothetical protein
MPSATTEEYDLFQQLSAVDSEELLAVWASVNEELEQISAAERGLLERRAKAERMRGVVASIASFLDVSLPETSTNDGHLQGAEHRDNRSRGSARDAARQIIATSDQTYWDADSLEAALEGASVTTSRSNVRVILQSLLREGLLQRVSHGRYEVIRED